MSVVQNRNPNTCKYAAWCRILTPREEIYYHFYFDGEGYIERKKPRHYKFKTPTDGQMEISVFIKPSVEGNKLEYMKNEINDSIKEHVKKPESIKINQMKWVNPNPIEKIKGYYFPLKVPYDYVQVEKDKEMRRLEVEEIIYRKKQRDLLIDEIYFNDC